MSFLENPSRLVLPAWPVPDACQRRRAVVGRVDEIALQVRRKERGGAPLLSRRSRRPPDLGGRRSAAAPVDPHATVVGQEGGDAVTGQAPRQRGEDRVGARRAHQRH